MIYNPTNEFDIQKAKDHFNKLISGTKPFEIKGINPTRSNQQNAYLHLILGWFALETGYTIEEVKYKYFKLLCNSPIFKRKKINKRGVEIEYVRSSSDLNTAEMTTAIERFRNWSASEGCYLPSPNENGFLLHVRQEIERNKNFL
ncbi:MAG: hypothetical protein ACRCZY_05845 [Phocaeicola sp.]